MKRGVEFAVNVENWIDNEERDRSEEEFTGSLTEQELQKIKEELGLIDDDGEDNPCSPALHNSYVNESEEDGSTPFDSPLTEAERKLLDEFTFGTTSSFPRSPSTSRSASLAEVADSLIKDLEKYNAHSVEYNNNYDSDQSDKDDLDDYSEYLNRGKERNDSDLGSSLSMASGVDGLEKLAEELALRKDNKSIENSSSDTSTLSMDLQKTQNGSEGLAEHNSLGSTPDNKEKSVVVEAKQVDNSHEMDVDFSAISSRSSSIESGSIPASVDSGLPVKDASTGQHRYFVVVAIDFGTTFSGYAFAFTREPESIHMMRRWEGGDPGVSNQKTPTTLLLRPDGTFHSFGFGARDFYHDLEPDEARKWLYFEKFKMALHTKKVNKLTKTERHLIS